MIAVKAGVVREVGRQAFLKGEVILPAPLRRKMQWKVEKLKRSIYVEAYFSNFPCLLLWT